MAESLKWHNSDLTRSNTIYPTWHIIPSVVSLKSELIKVTQITPTIERRRKTRERLKGFEFLATTLTLSVLQSLRGGYLAFSSNRFHCGNVRNSLARSFCSMSTEDTQMELDFISIPVAFHKGKGLKPVGKHHMAIDFGGTNVRVAVMKEGFTKVICNSPSVVAFKEKGEHLVGSQAKGWAQIDPTNTVFGIQRLLGRKFDDPEIQREMKVLPYKIVRAANGDAWVEACGRVYSPRQIVAFIIREMKEAAESYMGKSISNAVITFPIWWKTSDQLRARLEAGNMAGLDLQVGLNDSIAAAVSYGKEGLIAILDFGGKTFKASILKISQDRSTKIAGKSSSTDIFLGGEDFDNALVEYLVTEFKRTQAIDLTNDKLILQRLRKAAEEAKIELSSRVETKIFLPYIITDASGTKHLNVTLTRSKFESLVNNLIERTKNTCEICLEKACITVKQVDEVLLIGGMARVPKVQNVVAEIFGKEPSKWVNPDEAIVLGAAAAIPARLIREDVWEFLGSDDVNADNLAKGVVKPTDLLST